MHPHFHYSFKDQQITFQNIFTRFYVEFFTYCAKRKRLTLKWMNPFLFAWIGDLVAGAPGLRCGVSLGVPGLCFVMFV